MRYCKGCLDLHWRPTFERLHAETLDTLSWPLRVCTGPKDILACKKPTQEAKASFHHEKKEDIFKKLLVHGRKLLLWLQQKAERCKKAQGASVENLQREHWQAMHKQQTAGNVIGRHRHRGAKASE